MLLGVGGALAQLVRELFYGVSTSGTLQGCSSHSDGELWHNFLKQETYTQLFSAQEYRAPFT